MVFSSGLRYIMQRLLNTFYEPGMQTGGIMHRTIIPVLCLLTVITLPVPLAAQTDSDSETAAIEQVIRASIGWALERDTTLLFDSVQKDSTFFIFHPDNSTITGFDSFHRYASTVLMDPRFQATSFELWDLRICQSAGGDVAWFSTMLNDLGTWEGQPVGWENTRWTGVLEKQGHAWRIRQMHFSFSSDEMQASSEEE